MEYVAEELGVEVLKLPVLQRELSLRADPAAILALRRIIRQRRPDVLHTHTAKAGATGRLAAMSAGRRAAAGDRPHLPRPRPQRLLQPALGAGLPLDRACARAHVRDADRRQRRGSRRPRLVRRRAGAALRRRPVRLRPAAVERGGRGGAAGDARRDRRRRGDVRGRLGGPTDRDQAPARPDPHAARARGTEGVDALLVLVGRRRGPAGVEALAAELGVADRCRLVGFQKSIRPWYASFDALAADVGERGHAGGRDRGARGSTAGRRDPGRRHRDRRQKRRERLPRGDRRHGRAGGAARDPGPRPRAACADGRARGRGRARPFRGRADGRRGRGDLPPAAAREGPPPPQADRRQRLGGAPARAAPGSARARRRRALPRARRARHRCARASTTALDRLGVPHRSVRCGSTSARGWRATSSARCAPSSPTSSTPISCTPTSTAAPPRACSESRRSRPATTTTATCSARSATSTARSRARRAG